MIVTHLTPIFAPFVYVFDIFLLTYDIHFHNFGHFMRISRALYNCAFFCRKLSSLMYNGEAHKYTEINMRKDDDIELLWRSTIWGWRSATANLEVLTANVSCRDREDWWSGETYWRQPMLATTDVGVLIADLFWN